MSNDNNSKKKTILVVEDDVFISDIYKTKLHSEGYNIVVASNGKEAIEKLNSGLMPNLVLLDIVMPYVDGFGVLNTLKENEKWKGIPIILLTNLSQKEDIDKAMELGAKDYLIKSHFTPSEILKRVNTYII